MKAIAAGARDAQVALQLGYSAGSVRVMVNRLEHKAEVNTRPELIAWAFRNGVLK